MNAWLDDPMGAIDAYTGPRMSRADAERQVDQELAWRPVRNRTGETAIERLKRRGTFTDSRTPESIGQAARQAQAGADAFYQQERERRIQRAMNSEYMNRRLDAKQQAQLRAERQAEHDAEYERQQDAKWGLIPGTTRAFGKFAQGANKVATTLGDIAVDYVPGMQVVGSLYKAFAPPGSKYYREGTLADKAKGFAGNVAKQVVSGAVKRVAGPTASRMLGMGGRVRPGKALAQSYAGGSRLAAQARMRRAMEARRAEDHHAGGAGVPTAGLRGMREELKQRSAQARMEGPAQHKNPSLFRGGRG